MNKTAKQSGTSAMEPMPGLLQGATVNSAGRGRGRGAVGPVADSGGPSLHSDQTRTGPRPALRAPEVSASPASPLAPPRKLPLRGVRARPRRGSPAEPEQDSVCRWARTSVLRPAALQPRSLSPAGPRQLTFCFRSFSGWSLSHTRAVLCEELQPCALGLVPRPGRTCSPCLSAGFTCCHLPCEGFRWLPGLSPKETGSPSRSSKVFAGRQSLKGLSTIFWSVPGF